MRLLAPLSLAALALCATACAFLPADKLRPRAAYDLNCPAEQLAITELGGSCGTMLANEYTCTLGVRGCGQQATYIHVPRADWVMNSAKDGAPPAAPAAPKP